MCNYNKLLDLVPPEICSVPLILHSMLEQVCVSVVDEFTVKFNHHVTSKSTSAFETCGIIWSLCVQVASVTSSPSQTPEQSEPPRGPWIDQQLVSYMLQSFLPLVHTDEERSRMLAYLLMTVQNEEERTVTCCARIQYCIKQ